MSEGVAFIDNEYIPVAEARLPILDWGFTRSDVTYDVVSVWRRSFFRLDDHIGRFRKSCEKLQLNPGFSDDEIGEILINCVRKSGLDDAYVEMLCTRGIPAAGSRDPRDCANRFIAFAIPYVWILDREAQDRGVRLFISDIPRISPLSVDPTVKNFHWADLTRGLLQAYEHGDDTVVLVDLDGNISEGPGFNIFCVRDGGIITPGGTVLAGVTRITVKELCDELEIPYAQGAVSPDQLRGADEIFLSSTAGGIMPIRFVDNIEVRSLEPDSVSLRLRKRYWEKHDQGWHGTPID
jgi:branched-chain amino acid aminotransferase